MKLKEKLAAEMLLNENPQKYPEYSLPIELIQQPGIAGRAREIELILMGFEKAREMAKKIAYHHAHKVLCSPKHCEEYYQPCDAVHKIENLGEDEA